MRARWIAFEGGEGSGKSTHARALAERLGALLTREPGGTPVGERIRTLLLDPSVTDLDARAEALLMAADRAQHVRERVRPALEQGKYVVSDRSAFSSLAYQGYGRGLGVEEVREISDWASGGLWPDLVVLLDVDDVVRRERMKREPDRLEQAGDDFHQRVNEGFRTMAHDDPGRWIAIDARGPVEDVRARVDAAVDAWLAAHD